MVKEVECIVRGRVQAVTFRDFARQYAEKFGIVGSAENRPDGSLRIIAQGEERDLSAFIEKLHKGPEPARVEGVDVVERTLPGQYSNFTILYSM